MAAKKRKKAKKTTFLRRLWRWIWRTTAVIVLFIMLLSLSYSVINPVSALMLTQRLSGKTIQRDWVSLDDMGTPIIASVLAGEDARFCEHDGIDWVEFKKVANALWSGDKPRGASTITMQTTKNLFLWNSRSYLRKALEFPLALWLDLVLSKRRILEIYLNIAEWGDGVFGAGAASKRNFKRSPNRLSWRQSALLATTLPNPLRRNPAKPSRLHNALARSLEKRARQMGAYLDCVR